jgi:two-component system NtrC family sensor kinase
VRSRIGTRVIGGVALVTAASIGLMVLLILGAHERELIAERTREADRLSELIKSATHYDMLENQRGSLHRQIENIGRQEVIEKVRVFNKVGSIMFSSDARDVGASVDKRAEACYACHAEGKALARLPIAARTRVFRGADGERVLGIINPIRNEPGCSAAACHAHSPDQSVLGVLDVTVSLADVDRQTAQARTWLVGLAALTIAASAAILWWLNRRLVVRPVQDLAEGTRRIAEGDLTTTIPATASHELGDLARAFNDMARRLSEAQHQVTEADKLASVGRLAAGVAHEINNPLTGVLTYASLLLQRDDLAPPVQEDLQVVVHETKRCRDIVKGLLDFARRTPPKRQPTDLNDVVRAAAAVLMNQLKIDRVALTLDLARDLPPVPADANQIQQVLVNLLLNAADAIGEQGGGVTITTREARQARFVEVRVEDTGCGITPEALPHVFEPFFSTKGPRGTGLGLAVSWGIVAGHGGRMEVESEVGRGSRFTIRLPLVPEASAEQSAA